MPQTIEVLVLLEKKSRSLLKPLLPKILTRINLYVKTIDPSIENILAQAIKLLFLMRLIS